MTPTPPLSDPAVAASALKEIAEACEKATHPAAPICLSEPHLNSLLQIAAKARAALRSSASQAPSAVQSQPVQEAGRGARLEAQSIPWKDEKRQFPLYELAPDFTLIDRDPQADERLKLYRDIFAEITAKAIPVTDPQSDDPQRVRHYQLPVGPLHRAAGKLGFQLFDGERHLSEAVKEIARLKALPAHPEAPAVREALIRAKCTTSDGTYVHASMADVLAALAPSEPLRGEGGTRTPQASGDTP